MLYKYYRYILLLKIFLLLVWGYILYSSNRAVQQAGGTLITISSGSIASKIDTASMIEKLPLPWALVYKNSDLYSLHIPWTYDTWYVVDYMSHWLPPVAQTIDISRYQNECEIMVETQADIWKSTLCQKYSNPELIWAIIFILFWILL